MTRRGKTKRFPAWIGPRTVPVRSGHEGKKAPGGPTPKPIPTRCEPGRFAVRNIEHRTSNIQHPISKGGAKPPKATAKPYSRHILGIDSGVQSHPNSSLKPPQSLLIANRLGPQSHTNATLKPPQSHTKATPKPHQSHTKARGKRLWPQRRCCPVMEHAGRAIGPVSRLHGRFPGNQPMTIRCMDSGRLAATRATTLPLSRLTRVARRLPPRTTESTPKVAAMSMMVSAGESLTL